MLTPQVIYLETVNHCNARCIMCPHKYMQRPKGIMSSRIFETALQSISQINLNKISLFMHKEGEPLLDPNIIERIQYAKRKLTGFKELGINTNAMLLTLELSEKLLNSGLDTIYFSVDGASPETYNKIRINLDYDTVETNLKYFFALKRCQENKIRVVMQMLTNQDNHHEVKIFK